MIGLCGKVLKIPETHFDIEAEDITMNLTEDIFPGVTFRLGERQIIKPKTNHAIKRC